MTISRFTHEEAYRGKDLLEKLARYKIVVCGVGAIGSNLVDTLCRMGCSNLRVIDFDRVALENINTQIWLDGDVGALKVDALKRRVFNTVGVEIQTEAKRLEEGNLKKALKDASLVIDCLDNNSSRKLLQDHWWSKPQKAWSYELLHAGLHPDGYGEVKWSDDYIVPKDPPLGLDVCNYPLARPLILLTVSVLAEEIMDYCLSDKPRKKNWTITLRDLVIREI